MKKKKKYQIGGDFNQSLQKLLTKNTLPIAGLNTLQPGKKLTKQQDEYNPQLVNPNQLTDISTMMRHNQKPNPVNDGSFTHNQFGAEDFFNIVDPLAYLTIGIGNEVNDAKIRKDERNQYIDSIQNRFNFNTQEDGLNTNPAFFKKGGMNGCKYQVGGSPKSYNPNIASNDAAFQQWYNTNTVEGKNKIPFTDKLDYDYYSYYRNGDYKNYKGGHFPDTYKRPNHTTFSDESIYSVPENPGGHWMGENFIQNQSKKYQTGGGKVKYNEGDVLDLSPIEIEKLQKMGYQIEMV